MGQKKPRWVDKPEFAWTPETPLRPEPAADVPPHDILEIDRNRALRLDAFAPRLAVGLAQALILSTLLRGRADHWWPDNGVVAGAVLAATFAPLLLVQGLGRVSLRPLLSWTLFVALWLIGLGAYQHWRIAGADAGQSGLWLAAMITMLLFVGQSLLLGHWQSEEGPIHYPVLYAQSWCLAIEVALCGLLAASILWRGWPLPYMVLSLALTLTVSAQARSVLRVIARGLTLALTAVLPVLISLAVLTLLLWLLRNRQPPFVLCAVLGLLLVAAINASYRGGDEWRPHWRRYLEFAAALLLLPLAALCGLLLHARVVQLGFTQLRVMALASLLLLSAYALAYVGAAVISLGGGRWMARLERANLVMAFVGISLIGALVSPLADPARLAVATQSWRLTHGQVTAAAFDYGYLRKSGLRFGHEALAHLSRGVTFAAPSLRGLAAP